jgi:endonuclease YncB( thermonuclease family)
MARSRLTLTVLAGAAIAGASAGFAPGFPGSARSAEPLEGCRVVDGDTLRCGAERVRLLGIDAPELPGHCQSGRICAPGDPFASTDSLRAALVPPLQIDRMGTDQYGRTLALVRGARGDLSCWQLGRGQAIYKPQWDNGRRLAHICAAARG